MPTKCYERVKCASNENERLEQILRIAIQKLKWGDTKKYRIEKPKLLANKYYIIKGNDEDTARKRAVVKVTKRGIVRIKDIWYYE